MEQTKNRILKGIEYFKGIKPSEFNAGHYLHLKVFLDLVESFISGEVKEEPKEQAEIAKEVFNDQQVGA